MNSDIMENQSAAGETQASTSTPKPIPARSGHSSFNKLSAGLDRITIMMGILFCVGVGWVLWESNASGKFSLGKASPDEAMVKAGLMNMQQIATDGVAHKDKVKKMVETFRQKVTLRQVPLVDLAMNPFVSVGAVEAGLAEEKTADATTVPEKSTDATAQKTVVPSVANLQLQSVMTMGNVATATISGQLVGKGDIVGGWTVVEVQSQKVVLKWRNKKHVLDMAP